jgi:hypothetical protein
MSNPRRPKTAVLLTRCDLRSIATIAKFYQSRGIELSSKSGLVSRCVEDFCDLLVNNGKVDRFLSTSEARDYLAGIGLRELNRSGSDKAYLEQIQIENYIAESGSSEALTQEQQEAIARAALGLLNEEED